MKLVLPALLLLASFSLGQSANPLGVKPLNFMAQGSYYQNAIIETIQPSYVRVIHSRGATNFHPQVVPRALYDAFHAAQDAIKKKESFTASATITQVVAGGALARVSIAKLVAAEKTQVDPMTRKETSYPTGGVQWKGVRLDDTVFIHGLPPGIVDGGSWSGELFPTGPFQYTTVSGAVKTVRAFATTKEIAQVHLND